MPKRLRMTNHYHIDADAITPAQHSAYSSSLSASCQTTAAADLDLLIQAFLSLEDLHRDRFLAAVIPQCTKRTLSYAANMVMPRLKVDIVRQLPREVSLHIMSYLPVKSLCRLAQTAKYHCQLVNDDLLWRRLCERYEMPSAIEQLRTTTVDHPIDAAAPMDVDPTPDSSNTTVSTLDLSLAVTADPPHLTASLKSQSEGFGVDLNQCTPRPARHRHHDISPTPSSDPSTSQLAQQDPPPFAHRRMSFQHLFKSQFILRSNWDQGVCHHLAIEGPRSAIVTSLQFDERVLAIATDTSRSGLIELFDSRDGRLVRKMTGHIGGVWAMEFVGSTLVSGGCDRDLRVWDMATGQCRFRLEGHESTLRCLKMINESRVITGSRDNTIRYWDTETGRCLHVFRGHTGSIRCLALHENILVSGSYDNSLRLWDMETLEQIMVLQEHHAQVYSVAFDGYYVCSGSLDADIRVWNAKTGQCLFTLEGHDALVGHMQLRDGILVTGGSDGRVCVWHVATGTLLHRINAHRNSVTTLQFDQHRIITGGDDGVKMWDLKTGQFLRYVVDGVTGVWRLQFSPTKLIAAVQRGDFSAIEMMNFDVYH